MSRRTRRAVLGAAALLVLAAIAFVGLGFLPVPPDVPAVAGASREPGSGSLRRPFPAMAVRADNPGTPDKVALGRLLYFDPVLSGANDISCASCHHPDLGFTDGRGLAMGKGGHGVGPARAGGTEIRRGAPTIWNAAYNHRQFWDGRAADLEEQARGPITSPDEMDQKPEALVAELEAIPEYVGLFDEAFGGTAGSSVTFDNVTRAIAAFERTLVSDRSRFDRYAAGDPAALSPQERRGLALFRSLKTRCFECHGFPTFANTDFKVIGVPDLPGHAPDRGRAETGAGAGYERAFKVPTLRNVARTAPYMHNGKFQTLDEVLDFYAKGGGRGAGLALTNQDDKVREFPLTASEKADIIAFLGALTDESRRPEFPDRVPSGLPVVEHIAGAPGADVEASGTTVAKAMARKGGATKAGAPKAGDSKPGDAEAEALATTWRVSPGESIQAAVDRARPGDTVEINPGVYHESVLVDADRITLRGMVMKGERAVLDGEKELSDAVIASGDGFIVEGLAMRHYTSNGVTVQGANGVVFRDLVIDDTGLYGVYPVECKDVTIEAVTVTGAKDAALYVGQSKDIVVRGNEVHDNVTGIEIENSVNALVEENYAHDNTGGILVFLLPNNPSKVGTDTRVLRNRVVTNNHANFGAPGSIVSQVAPGTGIFVMAADRTEVAENEVKGNDSLGIGVVSLAVAFPKGTRFDVGIVPEGNRIHDNKLSENGRKPAPSVKAAGGGADLLWDGSGWDNTWEESGARSVPWFLPGPRWPELLRKAWSRAVVLAGGG
jgi:cytochrome c peroxidase